MKRCSEFAYAMCPYRHICGPQQDAVYMEGSDCDKFNEAHLIAVDPGVSCNTNRNTVCNTICNTKCISTKEVVE